MINGPYFLVVGVTHESSQSKSSPWEVLTQQGTSLKAEYLRCETNKIEMSYLPPQNPQFSSLWNSPLIFQHNWKSFLCLSEGPVLRATQREAERNETSLLLCVKPDWVMLTTNKESKRKKKSKSVCQELWGFDLPDTTSLNKSAQ